MMCQGYIRKRQDTPLKECIEHLRLALDGDDTSQYAISVIEDDLTSARAIMLKFVGKVDRGMAKSVETYAEMKEWLDDSC